MADNLDPVSEGFAALSHFFIADGTLSDTLTKVAELACTVSGADMAGITLLVEEKPQTGVFTDPEAPEIDRAQYDSGEGPCLEAFRHGRPYRIESVDSDRRWPEFSRAAAEHGIRCTLSLPIVARDESLGALNLYSRQPGTFDDEPGTALGSFVAQAAIMLANAQVYWDARQLSENLQNALQSRSTIDQAIGILMASGGRSPDAAFQLLIRASQRENRKLREMAQDIVTRTESRGSNTPSDGND